MLTNKVTWISWIVLTALLSSYYAYALMGNTKSRFLPGQTTSGHYQIELACKACHTNPFGGKEVLQKACVKCHGAELKAVEDSHPKSKFTDPRNADRTKILDARYCITCHKEHVEDRTHMMGVTLPNDFCAYCHFDIAKDRKSHKGMKFDTCANAGCHNFHDNKALYEDFLVKHANEPNDLEKMTTLTRDFAGYYKAQKLNDAGIKITPLVTTDANYPQSVQVKQDVIDQWAKTSHAKSAVNCKDCHNKKVAGSMSMSWIEKPGNEVCVDCHKLEVDTYQQGKHGMRLAQQLTPMQPKNARLEFNNKVSDKNLGCMSCHDAHRYDTAKAAIDACLVCHTDKHSKAYKKSPHFAAWEKAQTNHVDQEKAVSCATCHLPRVRYKHDGVERTLVQHNQNLNLRPNEKMIREVCMNCHGLGFSINSLADPELVARNFDALPSQNIATIEMAKKRVEEKLLEKKLKHTSSEKETGKDKDTEDLVTVN